jgi:hypothetical protein
MPAKEYSGKIAKYLTLYSFNLGEGLKHKWVSFNFSPFQIPVNEDFDFEYKGWKFHWNHSLCLITIKIDGEDIPITYDFLSTILEPFSYPYRTLDEIIFEREDINVKDVWGMFTVVRPNKFMED